MGPSLRTASEAQRHRGFETTRSTSLWLCVSVACGLWIVPLNAQQLLDRVVASVNGAPITLTDLNAAVGLGVVQGDMAAARLQLIDRQLMLTEVARFAPPEPDPAAVEKEVAALKAHAGANLATLIVSTGLDEQRISDLARDTLRIRAYVDQRFGTAIQVTDDEAERYYRENPQEFTRNGILIPFEDAAVVARPRVTAARRDTAIAQWVRDLRTRAAVTTRG
jgi:hypothetical protein